MKTYRYVHFDFEKNILPLGAEWKEPQVRANEAPDKDYYEVTDPDVLIPLEEDIYEESEIEGTSYVRKIASTLKVYVQIGTITKEEATAYGTDTKGVSDDLKKGWWHSAYYAHIDITPPTGIVNLHEEIRITIKDYVNSNYPDQFIIS